MRFFADFSVYAMLRKWIRSVLPVGGAHVSAPKSIVTRRAKLACEWTNTEALCLVDDGVRLFDSS